MKALVFGLLSMPLCLSVGASAEGTKTPQHAAAIASAGRVYAHMQACKVDETTQCTVNGRSMDWINYVASGDTSMSNSKSGGCGITIELAMAMLCQRVQCADQPPPVAPVCSEFLPRLRNMRIAKPGWTVTDGLD